MAKVEDQGVLQRHSSELGVRPERADRQVGARRSVAFDSAPPQEGARGTRGPAAPPGGGRGGGVDPRREAATPEEGRAEKWFGRPVFFWGGPRGGRRRQ